MTRGVTLGAAVLTAATVLAACGLSPTTPSATNGALTVDLSSYPCRWR
jgi:hypothetical protein